MIAAELHEERCWCGASLGDAVRVRRENVIFTAGEFRDEPGVVAVALCRCGLTSVIPLVVNLRRAA